MRRHPVLIPTSTGPLGGIVHEPDGDAVACLAALHGLTGRSGPNRTWARLADELAGLGIVVLRFDYPGFGESAHLGIDEAASEAGALEAIDWFRSKTTGLDLLLCGWCYGARACLAYAATRGNVVGLAMGVPALRKPANILRSKRVCFKRLVKVLKRRAPRIARMVMPSLATGRPDAESLRALAAIGSNPAPWILVGERDHQWRRLWVSSGETPELASAEIEIVPGMRMHGNSTLQRQQVVIDRVTAWASRTIRERSPA